VFGTSLVLLVAIAAGCGSKSPAVASLGTTTSPGGSASTLGAKSAAPSTTAFAVCLTSHGFAASVGSGGGGNGIIQIGGVTISGNVDPSSPQFQSALAACRKLLPGGGPPSLSPAQQAKSAYALARFAACMRKNGLPSFPDPNSQGFFALGDMKGIDPSSPLVQHAFQTCRSLEPKFGPRIQLG
jgi:hypothetical protein